MDFPFAMGLFHRFSTCELPPRSHGPDLNDHPGCLGLWCLWLCHLAVNLLISGGFRSGPNWMVDFREIQRKMDGLGDKPQFFVTELWFMMVQGRYNELTSCFFYDLSCQAWCWCIYLYDWVILFGHMLGFMFQIQNFIIPTDYLIFSVFVSPEPG